MQRNRKRESLRVGVVAKSLLICGYVAAVGLGYVWHKNQIYRLGDDLKKREALLLAAQKRNAMLAAQLAQLKSPAQLEARCQYYNLGLTAPREGQVVRLYEPLGDGDLALARSEPAGARLPAGPGKMVARR